jgi:hypothetical protein
MRVDIDQPGRYIILARIHDGARVRCRQVPAHLGDLRSDHRHVEHTVAPVRRIEDVSVLDEQIVNFLGAERHRQGY